MTTQLLLEPTGFIYGSAAKTAIKAGSALSLLGQNIAFTHVHNLLSKKFLTYSINDLPNNWKGSVDRFTSPLPLAGLPSGPLVMGIINVTPDSFSDGGLHYQTEDAVRSGHQMVQQGARILDIGGESTRPGSIVISSKEECERILPVIKGLKGCGALISIDTRHAETMKYALDAGVDIINDISALEDKKSAEVIAQAQCPVILMHMRGTPQTMGQYTQYHHVVLEVISELEQKIIKAEQAGIQRSNIILDPGIGFAKEFDHNIELLKHFSAMINLRCRWMLAVSRKRFIREAMQDSQVSHLHDFATMVASSPIFGFGNGIIRVHNVPAMVQSLKMWRILHT